jgi:hypothetical protein
MSQSKVNYKRPTSEILDTELQRLREIVMAAMIPAVGFND